MLKRLNPQSRFFALPSLFVSAAVLTFAATLFWFRPMIATLPKFVTASHIEMLSMYDSVAQRVAHKASLSALAMMVLLFTYATQAGRTGAWRLERPDQLFAVIRRYAGVIILAGMTVSVVPMSVGMQLELLLLAALILLLVIRNENQPLRYFQSLPATLIWALPAGLVVVLLLPGLFVPPALPSNTLFAVDWHYSATIAQGSRLAAGLGLGDLVEPNYGVLHILAQAAVEQHLYPLDFGAAMRLVQWAQVAFVLSAAIAFYLWRPRQPTFILFGLLFLGPLIGTLPPAAFFPNQSGWRFLGLAAGVLLLIALRKSKHATRGYTFGATSALLVLYNPETGIAVTCGYLTYLLLADGIGKAFFASSIRFAVSAALMFSASITLIYVHSGVWIGNPKSMAHLLLTFSGGYGGLKLFFDPLAFVIFLHAAIILTAGAIVGLRTGLSSSSAAKCAIAAVILVWSAYYWSRPQGWPAPTYSWNLWTSTFLYWFLIADKVSPRYLSCIVSRGLPVIADVRFALIFFLVMPQIVITQLLGIQLQINDARLRTSTLLTEVSGILIEKPLAELIKTRAEYVKTHLVDDNIVYIASAQYMLSMMTGRYNQLKFQDVFAETKTLEEFEALVRQIHSLRPSKILFGDPSSLDNVISPYAALRQDFERSLKHRLATCYRKTGTTAEWEIWYRKPKQEPPCDLEP